MSETPLTDHYTKRLRNLCDDEFVPIEFARNLERQLTAVTEERDELKSKYRTHHDEAERITNEIRRVSSVCRELREQRDMLAEALREIANEDYRGPRPWSANIAHKALAALKGGSHE